MCISGTIVPGHPSNPYYSCSSQSVSVFPLRAPVRSELRIPVVYRDPPRFPACSICKPPRNESVNPVTSFAAILALRRRYAHFPPDPPACLRLECKSVQTPAPPPPTSIGPHANSPAAPIIVPETVRALCFLHDSVDQDFWGEGGVLKCFIWKIKKRLKNFEDFSCEGKFIELYSKLLTSNRYHFEDNNFRSTNERSLEARL